jgi:hypothetical protein
MNTSSLAYISMVTGVNVQLGSSGDTKEITPNSISTGLSNWYIHIDECVSGRLG